MPNPKLMLLGRGDAPEKLLSSVVDDQLAAAAFNPIDIEIWVLEGEDQPPALSDLATYIEEEYEGLDYQWMQNRDGSSLVSAFRNSLAELGDARRARVLVLWDESTATRQAVQAALDAHIEVYDLSDALTRIGSLVSEDNYNKELSVPRSSKTKAQEEPTQYTYEELMDMDDDTIIPICEAFGINHEEYPDWETVAALIVERQSGGEQSEPEGEDEGGEEDGGSGYSKAQLESMELDTLKEICRVNEIEVEGQRPRVGKYVEAILAFQEANGISAGEDEPESEDESEESVEEETSEVDEESGPRYSAEDLANLLGSFQGDVAVIGDAVMGEEGLLALTRALAEGIDKGLQAVYERLGEVLEAIQGLAEIKAPAAAPSNGNGTPAKKVAAAKKTAAPVRRLTKP